MKLLFFICGLLVFTGRLDHSYAIRIEDFFEQPCNASDWTNGSGFVMQNYIQWGANFTLNTTIYLPMIAKLDLLRLSQDLLHQSNLSSLSGQDVLNSCMIFLSQPTVSSNYTGYCGSFESKTYVNNDPAIPQLASWNRTFPAGVDGILRVSLSDNFSWQLVDVCWGDGQRGWGVYSSRPRLSKCDERMILTHLKAIGFSENFVTGLTYDDCNDGCFEPQKLDEDPYGDGTES